MTVKQIHAENTISRALASTIPRFKPCFSTNQARGHSTTQLLCWKVQSISLALICVHRKGSTVLVAPVAAAALLFSPGQTSMGVLELLTSLVDGNLFSYFLFRSTIRFPIEDEMEVFTSSRQHYAQCRAAALA